MLAHQNFQNLSLFLLDLLVVVVLLLLGLGLLQLCFLQEVEE